MTNSVASAQKRIGRRPRDLVTLVVVLLTTVLITILGTLAAQTTAGLDADLTTASRELPSFVLFILNTIGATAIIFVPILVSISLILRNRSRQLIDALLASGISVLFLITLSILIIQSDSPRLILALTGGLQTLGVTPLDPLIAGLISFLVIARIFDRGKLGLIATLSVISVIFASLIAGQTTIVAQIINLLLGWSVGLIVRYGFGTPINRASIDKIKSAIEADGPEVSVIELALETTESRIFHVSLSNGKKLNVWVFDWELQGSGVMGSWWRGLTVRTSGDFRGMGIRKRVERTALLTHSLADLGIIVPNVEMVREIEPDSIFIALENINGITLAEHLRSGNKLTSSQLAQLLQDVKKMHDADIVHRSLATENILITPSGEIAFSGVHSGSIAATDLQQRVDLVEALVTAARLTSTKEATDTAKQIFDVKELLKVIPAIQRVAMSRKTREYLRIDKQILKNLRTELATLAPSADLRPIQFQRINWRNVLLAVASVFALYLLVPQFSQINIREIITTAQWQWAGIALVGSGLTYVASTSILLSFVPIKISWLRTLQAQLAASFATLVTPPALGSVAVNIRFLNRSGLSSPAAASAVGVSQVVIFFVHIFLLVVFGVVAGSQTKLSFRPPRITLVIIVFLIALIIIALSFTKIRNWLLIKTRPFFTQLLPTFTVIVQQPKRLIASIVSSTLLNIFYIIAFYTSVKAFGGDIPFATVAFVYLAGSTLGQVAPVPGGIGAVEAALVAGLTATGFPSGIALSAVLLYRVVTFWLPVIPGWFAFMNLQKKNIL